MSSFYRITSLAKGLDGLVVEGNIVVDDNAVGWVIADCIYNTNIVFGDRLMKSPISPGGLRIHEDYIVTVPDPNMEFSTENPFGEYRYEGTYVKGELNIAYTEFDNAISVTIFEKHGDRQKTLYSQNFFESTLMVMELIQAMLAGHVDPEDLVFELKRIKDEEKH